MSETSDRYARLSAGFAAKIAAVPADRWADPSPCEGWTALDVVRHVVESQGAFLGFVGRSPGEVPPVDDDPAAAWAAVSAAVQADLDDPDRASAEFDGFLGRTTLEAAADRFLCLDLVVHAWDLARATGLDERLDLAEVARVRRSAETLGGALRSPQAFGPALETPPGADPQAELLAFLGRQP